MIRPFREEDAEPVLALTRKLLPLRVETVESVLWEAGRSRFWVAEMNDEVVGFGRVRGPKLWLGVAQHARGHGLGAALWSLLEEHAEEPATCWTDNDEGLAFAQARGFTPTRRVVVSTLDVGATPSAAVKTPEGVELTGWSSLRAVPPELEAAEYLAVPHLLLEASVCAIVDGRPVAYSLMSADGRGLGESEYTFTLPAYRGRGLATLCKAAAIRRAGVLGVHTLVAGNDERNEPMLAVNRRLGYRPHHVRATLTRA